MGYQDRDYTVCRACQGIGFVAQACSMCRGAKKVSGNWCSTCQGTGMQKERCSACGGQGMVRRF